MKTIKGIVVSDKMTNTVVVEVERFMAHPLYHKRLRRTKKYHVHDELGAKIGNTVELVQTRPISKTKFWKTVKIVGQKDVPTMTVAAANNEQPVKPVEAKKPVRAKKPAVKKTPKA